MEWLVDHNQVVSIAVQIVTAFVWLVYLQLLLQNFRRERRSKLLLTRVAGGHERGHLMLGNMGAEPIFVKALLADLVVDGKTYHSIASDSGGFAPFGDSQPDESIKGPLNTAEYRDLGRISDLVDVALEFSSLPDDAKEMETVVFTVLAESSRDNILVAGRLSLDVYNAGEHQRFLPQSLSTEQLRSFRKRRELASRLEEMLEQEARAYLTGEDGKRRGRGAELGQLRLKQRGDGRQTKAPHEAAE
ncbi:MULTISPECIES: hypothetical protein [Thioclava]|uniref:Peptidase M41 domain-containing protein n=1 Tax=Thioclava nitratireducens TaxID=1915078 RepID=A0ABN4X3U0_9RHOB|nr:MULTISPECIES: hypothetical protein [Thioclava]OWY02197.1 hypothetical protein B6V76_12265 [Thioclava sp. IC9]OWY16559.1 hypothetical protein B6V73_11125 [Thioclava sp. JM3]AQS46655.1 hypothetical protein BMG03_01665 [Thioclava nitratireducens]OWY08367.1 hypothetical protein B6V74_14580 [Thioclava sp. F42-5]WGT52049.1 hypothetical protein P0N61_08515 [Thioclava nitratireducens]